MTIREVSIRMPERLAREVRAGAAERNVSPSAFLDWALGLALQDNLDISAFPDPPERYDCKLDFRLQAETLACLRPVCERSKCLSPFSPLRHSTASLWWLHGLHNP